jgi:hypothetical protein
VLESVRLQTLRPGLTIVVDNDNDALVEGLVESVSHAHFPTQYVASAENLGSAGGRAMAMEQFLNTFSPQDWLVLIDDDKPLKDSSLLEDLLRFAERCYAEDSRTGGVGLAGARWDRRNGTLSKVSVHPDRPKESVDYLGAGHQAMFRHSAIEKVGPFKGELFFGMSEVEYGLRLRAAGFNLWLYSEKALERRQAAVGLAVQRSPSRMIESVDWRRYYSLRNGIYIAYKYGGLWPACKVALVRGVGKSFYNLRRPGLAWAQLEIACRAIIDASLGRMGKRIDPLDWEQKHRLLENGEMRPT